MPRPFPLDRKLLFFDRETGENVLCSGEETAHLVMRAPRVLQVAITNVCNKSCAFCYRPMDAESAWTFDSLVELARFASRWGVLELAFGGGEPTVFPRFGDLLRTIWRETDVCPSFTTNGTRLTREWLASVAGSYGQIQLSIYDDEDWRAVIDTLAAARARFGLNYLVTPERLPTLEADVLAFWSRGARDVLLLSYKGDDPALHLSARECSQLDAAIIRLHERFAGRFDLKVDVCWGSRLPNAPTLFPEDDCAAGRAFLSITSHKRVLSCSFADGGVPFSSPEELPAIWERLKVAGVAAEKRGCARLPSFGARGVPEARRALPLASAVSSSE